MHMTHYVNIKLTKAFQCVVGGHLITASCSVWQMTAMSQTVFFTSEFTMTLHKDKERAGKNCERSDSPVQSPQSWPLVRHHLFLWHWIECRLALSWGGRKCRPWPVCDPHRWSWSPRRHTSASTASHRSLLHNVSGAGAEIGSYWLMKKQSQCKKLINCELLIFTPQLQITWPPNNTFIRNQFPTNGPLKITEHILKTHNKRGKSH